jgi:hypothetical protein
MRGCLRQRGDPSNYLREGRAGPKYVRHTDRTEFVDIGDWNDASNNQLNVVNATPVEFLPNPSRVGHMSTCQDAKTNYLRVFGHRDTHNTCWRLPCTEVHNLHARIAQRPSDEEDASFVPVQPWFS